MVAIIEAVVCSSPTVVIPVKRRSNANEFQSLFERCISAPVDDVMPSEVRCSISHLVHFSFHLFLVSAMLAQVTILHFLLS